MISHGFPDIHDGGHIQASAAVFFRHVDAPEAQIHQLANGVDGADALLIVLCNIGVYFLAHERMNHFHQIFLVTGHQLIFTHIVAPLLS